MTNDTNSLDLVPVIFGAGESRQFALSGTYFELIDCPTPVDVVLSDVNGSQRVRMKSAEASFYSKDVAFATVQITSAGAQTIRFAFGTGEAGTRRSTGSVTIASAVALDAPTLAALESVGQNLPVANLRPSSVGVLGAGAVSTLMTPAQNVNGAIVLSASILELNAASSQGASLIAKSGAVPVNIGDGEVLMIMSNTWNNGTNTGGFANLCTAREIPAGFGLYVFSISAMSANSLRSAAVFTK